jgi:hypothetical protein
MGRLPGYAIRAKILATQDELSAHYTPLNLSPLNVPMQTRDDV